MAGSSRISQEVIVYHDDTAFMAGRRFLGHALFLVPTKLSVLSTTPLFGQWCQEYSPLEDLCAELRALRAITQVTSKFHFEEISGKKWGASDQAHRAALALATDALKSKHPDSLRRPLHCKLAILFFSKDTDVALYGGESREEKRLRQSETVLRMLLKGALNLLYDDFSSVLVKGIVTDGQPHYRPLDNSRVLWRISVDERSGRTPLRKNVKFAEGARIVHLPSDHKKHDENSLEASHANMLQLTDLLLGAVIRSCYKGCTDFPRIPTRGTSVSDKKSMVAYPMKEVLKKVGRGRAFGHSGHFKAFAVSFVEFRHNAVIFRPVRLKDLRIESGIIPLPFRGG